MACSSRTAALRHLAGSGPARASHVSHQQRWASVHAVRFLATSPPRPAVLDKYRDQLSAKARREGHADVDGLRAAYADRIRDVRLGDVAAVPVPPPPAPSLSGPAAADATAAAAAAIPRTTTAEARGPKPLAAILDLAKARALPDRELAAVWRLRHAADARSLAAVIPAATYARMAAVGRAYPRFVLPVPHADRGAEMHFLQWTFDDGRAGRSNGAGGAADADGSSSSSSSSSTVLFARLAEYKLRGEWAAPHTTVTHYTDLAAERGAVLMRGQMIDGAGAVGAEEARWLVMCLQRFYGATEGEERGAERRRLLEWFAAGDARFSVEALMDEAERFG